MFVKGSQESRINAVLCVSGDFKLTGDSLPAPIGVQLEMSYLNTDDGAMYGGYKINTSYLRETTMDALRHFLDLAEEDFGAFVFGAGVTVNESESEEEERPNTGMAESNRGV